VYLFPLHPVDPALHELEYQAGRADIVDKFGITHLLRCFGFHGYLPSALAIVSLVKHKLHFCFLVNVWQ
jgi:hypothetical protein